MTILQRGYWNTFLLFLYNWGVWLLFYGCHWLFNNWRRWDVCRLFHYSFKIPVVGSCRIYVWIKHQPLIFFLLLFFFNRYLTEAKSLRTLSFNHLEVKIVLSWSRCSRWLVFILRFFQNHLFCFLFLSYHWWFCWLGYRLFNNLLFGRSWGFIGRNLTERIQETHLSLKFILELQEVLHELLIYNW